MAALSLVFDIIARDRNASRTLNDVGDSAERSGRRFGALGGAAKAGMLAVGAAVAAGGVAAVVGLKGAVEEASNLGESVNAVNVVFGDAAEGVLKLSDSAAQAVGLSKVEFNGLAVQFSNYAQTIAGAGGDVTGVLGDMTGRAADFASVMNLDVAEAASIFQSALAGETEPIKAFGIDLSAAAVEAYALANGIGTAGKEMTEAEKTQARYALLMRETDKTAGDFANTSDSLANRQRILGATFDNIQARIGTAFLPMLESLAGVVLNSVMPAVEGFITGMENGTGAAGRIAGAVDWLKDTATTAFTYFRSDVLPVLQAFVGLMQSDVIPRVQQFAGFIASDVLPRLQQLGAFLSGTVYPALLKVQSFLATTFQPTFQALVVLFREHVVPGLLQVKATVELNLPVLQRLAGYIGTVTAVAGALVAQVAGWLLPILAKLAGFLLDVVVLNVRVFIAAITALTQTVETVVGAFISADRWVGEFIDDLENFRTPQAIKDLGAIFGTIAGAAEKGVGWLGRVTGLGDGPGRVVGGNTLARVQGILPSGAMITSTYRTPARNRAIGGSPSSYHLDRNNPAVDIAGPASVLDGLYGRLAAMGGWRELLWRVAGHYDHIHVAHAGGVVSESWARMPGDRYDERTARLQVGERVVPKGGGGPTIAYNAPVYVVDPARFAREQVRRWEDALAVI